MPEQDHNQDQSPSDPGDPTPDPVTGDTEHATGDAQAAENRATESPA